MEKRPTISVIIPVYNCAQYLRKCLDSVVYQTYENLEIICVNDGSTDESADILKEYSQKDKRIQVHYQENSGASVARNFGMSMAKGDYISFFDADDWQFLDLYQVFVQYLNNAKKYVDIYMFNTASYYKNDVVRLPMLLHEDWNNHTDDYHIHVFDDCKRPFTGNLAVWNKIYNRKFLEDLKIQFPVGMQYEDQYFVVKTGLNAKSILINFEVYHRYRNYEDGSVTTSVSPKVFDMFKITKFIEEELRVLNVYDDYKYAFFQHNYTSCYSLYNLCPLEMKEQFFNEMKSYLTELEQDLDMHISMQLMNYHMYDLVKYNDFSEFDAQYTI